MRSATSACRPESAWRLSRRCPPGHGPGEALKQARAALGAVPTDTAVIVRRYREKPSPLVKDNVRGWRTGLLERVLDGDFDLFGG